MDSKNKNPESMHPDEFCPMRETVKLLGKQWTILIIMDLYYSKNKTLSFMELSRKLKDASSKVLSERLKDMTGDGLLKRNVDDTVKPPRVHYKLTKKGEDACNILHEFKRYGLRWPKKATFDCTQVDCELCPKAMKDNAVKV
jgi:DNA-binding HxlR family transcriptional regulator